MGLAHWNGEYMNILNVNPLNNLINFPICKHTFPAWSVRNGIEGYYCLKCGASLAEPDGVINGVPTQKMLNELMRGPATQSVQDAAKGLGFDLVGSIESILGGMVTIQTPKPNVPAPAKAIDFLNKASKHMQDRAVTYDAPQGERSMETVVQMFNTLKGTNLSVTDGWEFMMLLKMVRANQGEFKSDNYEDLVAYAALTGEQAAADHQFKAAN